MLAKRAMILLRDNCVNCHNPDKSKGDLDLTESKTARIGGSEGPAFIDGNPDESRLVQLIQSGSDPHMPPKKQLSDEDINTLSRWILAGAPWITSELAIKNRIAKASELGDLPDDYRPVFALMLSPDDQQLAAGCGNQVIVNNFSGKISTITKLSGHRDAVQSIAWSPDGKLLATGGFRKVNLWKTANWLLVGEINELPGRVTALTFSLDGRSLISASNASGQKGKISIWNSENLDKRLEWSAHDGTIYDITLSPDGEKLATGGEDKLIRLWDLVDGKQLKQIEAHSAPVMSLAFKPDGTAIASGAADQELKIWDIKTREQKNLVIGHPGNIASIVWPANNAELITASDDGALRLCSESSKSPLKTWAKAADLIYSLDVTTDAKRFFGGSEKGQVYEWDRNGKIIRTLVFK
ncbi:MAG: hypothetical protein CMO69_08055 [Verrucomicrobiales bacterium]|nr:hypothetical protein [Verrucomicrobiales bacterium]